MTIIKPLLLFLLVVCSTRGNCIAESGAVSVADHELTPGARINLTGSWSFVPGYSIAEHQRPEFSATYEDSAQIPPPVRSIPRDGSTTVAVPQILSRIRWWLDDSEEFNRLESERLQNLGFDAERAEDGWYHLEIDLPALMPRRQLLLEFEGVAMRCEVYWNGSRLGRHNGMFSRFSYPLRDSKPGKNLLSVFVSMEKIPPDTLSMGEAVTVNLTASKVRSMSKGMFGPLSPSHDNRAYDLYGIWQPVRLHVIDQHAIQDVWFRPSLDGADVVIDPGLQFSSLSGYSLKATWTDVATGQKFAEVERKLHPEEYAGTTLTLSGVQPKLWSPSRPNLYNLNVALMQNGRVLDRWSDDVGFRTFEARGNQLFLNGRPYWIRGVNHLPYGKNPADPALPRKLIQYMHDNNQRVTRTHCTPWNEAWLDAADEIGLGVSVEGMRPWALAGKIGATPPALMKHWLTENEDVIRRCRNHPSVLIWTVGNEMLIRDDENVEKWEQLSAVVKQTRALDPDRPVVCSSSYERQPKHYQKIIQPNHFDDGDIDDIHSYRGWYSDSPFVTESKFRVRPGADWRRPFIGQEMSTGYPDLDTGIPTLRYTVDLMTPQAWVGMHAYPGADPAVFLEHHAIVTKRWAEQLRFQREDRTAGFMLFANECWFQHSYDAARAKPYPVVDAVRYAYAPVGLALKSGRRRFFSGEQLRTSIFITNDHEEAHDMPAGQLRAEFRDRRTGEILPGAMIGNTPAVAYYETAEAPVLLPFPEVASGRRQLELVIRLTGPQGDISESVDPVEVFAKMPEVELRSRDNVVIVPPGAPLDELTTGGKLHEQIRAGATAIVFSPREVPVLFPDDVLSTHSETGEYADWAPISGSILAEGLEPMDLKWWARENDWRVFVARQSHRLAPGGSARELVRFIPSHGYTAPERLPLLVRTVLFEIPIGSGRLWVCDLDLNASSAVDPAARLFARNLMKAAADPRSTRDILPFPSHEQIMQQRSLQVQSTGGLFTK